MLSIKLFFKETFAHRGGQSHAFNAATLRVTGRRQVRLIVDAPGNKRAPLLMCVSAETTTGESSCNCTPDAVLSALAEMGTQLKHTNI